MCKVFYMQCRTKSAALAVIPLRQRPYVSVIKDLYVEVGSFGVFVLPAVYV